MPSITGLTFYQKDLLDCMWAIDTPDEFAEWYHNLDQSDQREVDLLKLLLVYELLDEVEDVTEALEVIERVK